MDFYAIFTKLLSNYTYGKKYIETDAKDIYITGPEISTLEGLSVAMNINFWSIE